MTAKADKIDERFTDALIRDVVAVLERHGYQRTTDQDEFSLAVFLLAEVTRAFEGGGS